MWKHLFFFFWSRKAPVGPLDLLESLLGLGVIRVAVRMVFHGQTSVSPSYLRGCGIRGETQDSVWIALELCQEITFL